MNENRSWMYSGWDQGGTTQMSEWTRPQDFFYCAFLLSYIVWCPCSRCQNARCLENNTIIVIHLCKNGFMPGYEVWKFHGESGTRVIAEDEHDCDTRVDRMDKMLEAIQAQVTEDPPTAEVEVFFKIRKNHCMNTQK
jgi:hypothetical protein